MFVVSARNFGCGRSCCRRFFGIMAVVKPIILRLWLCFKLKSGNFAVYNAVYEGSYNKYIGKDRRCGHCGQQTYGGAEEQWGQCEDVGSRQTVVSGVGGSVAVKLETACQIYMGAFCDLALKWFQPQ